MHVFTEVLLSISHLGRRYVPPEEKLILFLHEDNSIPCDSNFITPPHTSQHSSLSPPAYSGWGIRTALPELLSSYITKASFVASLSQLTNLSLTLLFTWIINAKFQLRSLYLMLHPFSRYMLSSQHPVPASHDFSSSLMQCVVSFRSPHFLQKLALPAFPWLKHEFSIFAEEYLKLLLLLDLCLPHT